VTKNIDKKHTKITN